MDLSFYPLTLEAIATPVDVRANRDAQAFIERTLMRIGGASAGECCSKILFW